MMIIGITGSVDAELSFVNKLNKISERKIGAFTYTSYEYASHCLVVSACGTGKASAAANTALLITEFAPNLILNMGTAGAVSYNVRNKDIVVAQSVVQHDYDISEFGYGKNELCELRRVYLPADARFIECAKLLAKGQRIHSGVVCSGDHLITTREQRENLISRFDGLAAEMEGGATAQIALTFGVPFALLKGISDGETEGESDAQFRENIGTVGEIIGELLLKILEIY